MCCCFHINISNYAAYQWYFFVVRPWLGDKLPVEDLDRKTWIVPPFKVWGAYCLWKQQLVYCCYRCCWLWQSKKRIVYLPSQSAGTSGMDCGPSFEVRGNVWCVKLYLYFKQWVTTASTLQATARTLYHHDLVYFLDEKKYALYATASLTASQTDTVPRYTIYDKGILPPITLMSLTSCRLYAEQQCSHDMLRVINCCMVNFMPSFCAPSSNWIIAGITANNTLPGRSLRLACYGHIPYATCIVWKSFSVIFKAANLVYYSSIATSYVHFTVINEY